MEAGLWQINPNLIENIKYYISLMPQAYRGELIEYTNIDTPMGCAFSYREWTKYNFDGNYNLTTNIQGGEEPKMLEGYDRDNDNYYFLLFFFSAFKRSPEELDPDEVYEWMIRCLLDVWMKDPSITPYYPQLKNWTESEWYEGGNNSIVWRHLEENRLKVGIWDIMDGRSYGDVGLTQTMQSGLYQLFISPVFDMGYYEGHHWDIGRQHLIRRRTIDKDEYLNCGEELGISPSKVRSSYSQFITYWNEYDSLIPIGFLSKKEEQFKFLNYSLKSFAQLK